MPYGYTARRAYAVVFRINDPPDTTARYNTNYSVHYSGCVSDYSVRGASENGREQSPSPKATEISSSNVQGVGGHVSSEVQEHGGEYVI